MEERKAKTHKGRKILEKRKGLINEDPKIILFIRGTKSNDVLNTCMKELVFFIYARFIGIMEWVFC